MALPAPPPSTSDPLADAKRQARARMIALRDSWDPAQRDAAGEAVGRIVLRECPPRPGAVVSGFWPIGTELDLRPLLRALHARGHAVVLPVTPRRGEPLIFRLWTPDAPMRREAFGTFAPEGEARRPDFLLVPLLAFDRKGNRLGYGAGFYDRTLAGLPGAFALGCAYAGQELPEVPAGPHDHRLDAIVTEREVIRVPGAAHR